MCPEPEPVEFQPHLLVLCCREALAHGADLESHIDCPGSFSATQLLVPCLAKIEVHHLLQYIAQGVDGVEIIGCPKGECQFPGGEAQSAKRIERAREMLVLAGMKPDRIGIDRGAGLSAAQATALVDSRARAIRQLGSNPMKREHAK